MHYHAKKREGGGGRGPGGETKRSQVTFLSTRYTFSTLVHTVRAFDTIFYGKLWKNTGAGTAVVLLLQTSGVQSVVALSRGGEPEFSLIVTSCVRSRHCCTYHYSIRDFMRDLLRWLHRRSWRIQEGPETWVLVCSETLFFLRGSVLCALLLAVFV